MTHFLDLDQIGVRELQAMLQNAHRIKAERKNQPKGKTDADAPLEGHVVALLFEKPSTRTRVSFDVGVRQMGGQTLMLTGAEMQLGHGESVADTARVLSRYVDMIMIRTFEEEVLHELAQNASVPVINGLTNQSHPCQIMADLMTYEERCGSIAGKRVVWLGDGNNVTNSYFHAAGQFGFDMTFCGPESLRPSEKAAEYARERGCDVQYSENPDEAVEGADLIITDTWVSMHDADSTRQRRHNMLRPYQVNEALMERAGPQALFTHCLPAHREEEVTSEVLDGKQSMALDAAENRLHAQKAIMRWCLGV